MQQRHSLLWEREVEHAEREQNIESLRGPARYCIIYTERVGNGISMPLSFRVL
jgi:hypothetical protein